jgi:hypothetical protein
MSNTGCAAIAEGRLSGDGDFEAFIAAFITAAPSLENGDGEEL